MDEKPRLLIVDDDDSICRTLELVLTKRGYQVEAVVSGTEAMERARNKFYNLALLDIRLPDVKGTELLLKLKEMQPEMTIIMMTGYASVDNAVQSLNAGASAYITKPLNLDEVFVVAREALEKQRLVREKHRAEVALLASERKYRRLFEESRDAIYLSTVEGRIVDINQAGLDLFGYSKQESIDLDTVEFHADSTGWEQFQKEIHNAGAVRDFEVKLRKKNGEQMICLISAAPWYDVDGSVVGYQGILRDVTQQREAERIARLRERLAAIGQIATGMAHDFNNILGAIILFSQLTHNNQAIPTREREYLEKIIQQANRGSDLIQQVLDFSRQSMLHVRALDLCQFLHEMKEFLSRTLPESITISLDTKDSDSLLIKADPARMQQAIMNLALNARDAMPSGGILALELIKIHVEPGKPPMFDMAPGSWVQIRISDTGSGIPSGVLPHIYEPFFTTKPPGEGTGLGLAQVYGIVKQHGGYIDVETEIDRGTAFTLSFPELQVGTEYVDKVEQPSASAGEGETVLVVEDDSILGGAVAEILQEINYRVLVAPDGEEAAEIYQDRLGEIDVVLSDVVMPKMGGLDLYLRLREVDPGVKMVFMSGYPQDEGIREMINRKEVGLIQKPFNTHDISLALRSLLD